MLALHSSINLNSPPKVVLAARGVHGSSSGPLVETYLLPHLWTLHVYPYVASVRAGDHVLQIRPGTLTLFPPNLPLEYRYRDRVSHYFVHFQVAPAAPESCSKLPFLVDLGQEFPGVEAQLRSMALDTAGAARQASRLWELLWSLTESESRASHHLHPSLTRAMSIVASRLDEPLSVSRLARESGISHNQLTRLFRAHSGTTVVGYIRRQRVERALHLLRQTSMPMRVIASQVGVPDAQQFSALVKKETGNSPRFWRHQ